MPESEYKLIGIAAPTCAGKTTLLNEITRHLHPLTILNYDNYDLFPDGSDAMDAELRDPTIVIWEDPQLFDGETYVGDLRKIKEGQPLQLQTRSRESMQQGENERDVVPSRINIVEGVFVYHDPRARDLFDLRFFIDIPTDVMIARRLARSGNGSNPWDQPSYINHQMLVGTEYNVMPQKQHAHIVLDGTKPTEELADFIVREIKKRFS